MIDYDDFFFNCNMYNFDPFIKINTSITQKNVRFYVILIKSKYTAIN